MSKPATTQAQIQKQRELITRLEEEVEVILMERIRDRANEARYDRMIQKREEQIQRARAQIQELEHLSEVLKTRQAKLKHDISLMDDILSEGQLSEAHLRLLVERIYVHEGEQGLELEIQGNTA